MFYKKEGIPETGDIVTCTVNKILFHSVFVTLDEYNNKEGLVHISEVSPGRIRNLRDFVKEGKTIVCKVLRINREGNIDLSLRRVSTTQKINKLTEMKQEMKAEKLLQFIGKGLKKNIETMYKEVGYQAIEKFGSLNNFFLEIVINGPNSIESMKISKNILDVLIKLVKEKIAVPEVKIAANLNLKSYSPDGIDVIKKILSKIKGDDVRVFYLGAPKYKIELVARNYKEAESRLKEISDLILKEAKKLKTEGEINKIAA
ncbi:translation initiation factor IF-2 subunit alpha [Candidatus Woesearchaeota archaeon]|nr:translation initiation factor IF-2 subunit alpha [Candidatus Woesearchaeota archaeon]